LFLGDKSETLKIFKTFARRAHREYNSSIVKIQSDNGSEFKNMNIEYWRDKEGVKHEFSTTSTLNKIELLNARIRP
jgi:transposase InsO family protein